LNPVFAVCSPLRIQARGEPISGSNISTDMKKPYPERAVPVQPLLRDEAQKVWLEFRKMPDGAKY